MAIYDYPLTAIIVPEIMHRNVRDLEELMQSIDRHGLLHPIVLLPDGTLVVGFRRVRAFKELGRETIPARIIPSIDSGLDAMMAENEYRQDYTLTERARIASAMLAQKQKEARQRQLSCLKRGDEQPAPETIQERGEALDLAARGVGMSGRHLRKILEMQEQAERYPAVAQMVQRMDETGKVNGIYKSMHCFLAEQEIKEQRPTRITAGTYQLRVDELVCADVCDILPKIPDATFDGVLADVPYGVGVRYGEWQETDRDPEAYSAWLLPIYDQLYRLLKPGGFCAIWQSQVYYPYFWKWFGREGVKLHIFVSARNWIPFTCSERMIHSYDPVITFYKPGQSKLVPSGRGRNKDFFVSNMKYDSLAHLDIHPCVKAMDVCRYLVENFVLKDGLILDPTCGLGSIPIAAKLLGRHFIGVEQNPTYVRIARERLRKIDSWETVERLSVKGSEEVKGLEQGNPRASLHGNGNRNVDHGRMGQEEILSAMRLLAQTPEGRDFLRNESLAIEELLSTRWK